MRAGVGRVPTNSMINAFSRIPATPFGTGGDLILVPDPAAEAKADFGDGSAGEHFFLGDIRRLDGTPWECCPRDFARRELRRRTQAGRGRAGDLPPRIRRKAIRVHHGASAGFLLARLSHFFGFRSEAAPGVYRVLGMALTFAVIGGLLPA